MSEKTYKIVETISDDAPYGYVNWFIISFLTPQKLEDLRPFDVKGFKIHNGFSSYDTVEAGAKKIKQKYPNHDVFVAEMGKIYSWDDVSKTDAVHYDDSKLTSMEKSRREDMDTIKLLTKQKMIDMKEPIRRDSQKSTALRQRFLQKLHAKGKISKLEMDNILMRESNENKQKCDSDALKILNEKAKECVEDYLTENDPTGLKYGCISIYSPKTIKGLSHLCFKVRGLSESLNQIQKRVRHLTQVYPDDKIYLFEVGKWSAFSESDDSDHEELNQQLNYCMKHYLENLKKETEAYEERKKEMIADKTAVNKVDDPLEDDVPVQEDIPSFGNKEDDENVKRMMEWITDKELVNKYSVKKEDLLTQVIDVS